MFLGKGPRVSTVTLKWGYFYKEYEQAIKATGDSLWGNRALFCPLGFIFCNRRKPLYLKETCDLRMGTERNTLITYNI